VLYCGKGNNSGLIKSIFRTTRPWWTVEENHPDNSTINMFWFQLRQNDIIDNFKDNNKTEADLEHCEYYLEQTEEKIEKDKEAREGSSQGHKPSQLRSQSVTQKDIKSTLKLGTQLLRQLTPNAAPPEPKASATKKPYLFLKPSPILAKMSKIKSKCKEKTQARRRKLWLILKCGQSTITIANSSPNPK
jgi:hypothetical protein